MNLKSRAVSFFFFLIGPISATEATSVERDPSLYDPKVDERMLCKDQRSQLLKTMTEIDGDGVFYLSNRKESLQLSLKTHDKDYTEAQKAYKRILLWHIEQRLRGLVSH